MNEAPERIGNYRILRALGQGGMGVVFEALHEHIGQRAAVKLLRSEYCRDPAVVQRFFNEARAASRVAHPSLVKIFDFGMLPDGRAYLLMERLAGESLAGRLQRVRRFEVPVALRLARQLAAALAAVHESGVVHRDLKPGNVFLVADPEAEGGERVKLLDFGIAKIHEGPGAADAAIETGTGVLLGTPVYMAPEQCRGARGVDEKADVYALGVMLYQMLAGRPPFEGSPGGLIIQHVTEPPPPLPALNPSPSPEVLTLLAQMLAKDPKQRPATRQVEAALLAPLRSTRGAVSDLPTMALAPLPGTTALPPQTTLSVAAGQLRGGAGWSLWFGGALGLALLTTAGVVVLQQPGPPALPRGRALPPRDLSVAPAPVMQPPAGPAPVGPPPQPPPPNSRPGPREAPPKTKTAPPSPQRRKPTIPSELRDPERTILLRNPFR